MRPGMFEMFARCLAVVDDLAAKLVLLDVTLFFGRKIRAYVKAKEHGIAKNAPRAL
jgi:hypothetical protein